MTSTLALALLLASACDEPEPRAQAKAEPASSQVSSQVPTPPSAKTDDPGLEPIAVTPPSTARARGHAGAGAETIDPVVPSPAAGESLAECLERCGSAELSADNRATCRLLCESYHGPKTSKSNDALVSRFFGCFDQCENPSCQTGCASDTGSSACARGCLETLARCLPACAGADGLCSERCETAARRCLGAC